MEGRQLEIFTVNAFTSEPFAGNPAGVCLLPEELSDDAALMQQIAAQLRHSETAFVTRRCAGDEFGTACHFGLRWFTPTTEVQLCGHGTLSAAAIIFKVLGNPSPLLHFFTRWDVELTARRDGHRIVLELPLNPPQPVPTHRFQALIEAVVGPLLVKEAQLSTSTRKLLVRLDDSCSLARLLELEPDTSHLRQLHDGSEVRGVIVTLNTTSLLSPHHFNSRYFAPWVGIPEDPVTGSAHTVLGPFWARELGSDELVARQCSPRGGDVYVRVDWQKQKTEVAGEGAVVLRGKMRV